MSGSALSREVRHASRQSALIPATGNPLVSARKKLERQRLEKFNAMPLPSGLLEAFDLVDAIDRHHPEARGCHPAGILRPPVRANRSTLDQDGR
jgi:hypothetical protein